MRYYEIETETSPYTIYLLGVHYDDSGDVIGNSTFKGRLTRGLLHHLDQ
jgi:hypothetical protein